MLMVKRILKFFAIPLAFSSAIANAEPVLIDGIYYELSYGSAIVTNNGDPFSSYQQPFVEIPSVVDYNGSSYIVEEIGPGAFSMTSIMEVYLPPTVRRIGGEAFRNCGYLRYLNLPEDVIYIGGSAFEWCSNLSIDHLPMGLDMVGDKAFAGVQLPETLQIPANLHDIYPGAFYGTPVKTFEVDSSNTRYASLNGILCSKDMKTLVAMPPSTDLKSYTVDSCFSEIGTSAFAGCPLEKIVVPDNVSVIESYAFQGCGKLKEISLPSTISVISQYMLSSCRSLKSLEIPEGVTSIYQYAISWCDSLSNVKFPSTLKEIKWTGFYRTDGLVNLELPEGLEILGASSFAQCLNLESVSIPASVKQIDYSPFDGCEKLRKISVDPNNKNFVSLWNFLYTKDLKKLIQVTPVSRYVTVVEGTEQVMEMAAWGCKSMERLVLPSTLNSIRDLAFAFCNNLTDVYCASTVPPGWASDRCFNGVANRENCTLYVPTGCVDAYRASSWNVFVNIKEYDPSSITFLPAEIYLTGSFNNWDTPLYNEDSRFVLSRDRYDANLYTGNFEFNSGNVEFKVFERPTDWSDALGFWGASGDVTYNPNGYSVGLGAGSEYGNIVIADWNGGMAQVMVDLRKQQLTVIPLPDAEPQKYVLTEEVVSGGTYAIVAGDRVTRPLQGSYAYGYLPAIMAEYVDFGVRMIYPGNTFTITAKDGHYTLQDPMGRFYYMQGSYNNFNVASDFPGQGALWDISFNESGELVMTNVYNDKIFVYSMDYLNFAAYVNQYYGNNVLPKLYKLDSDSSVEILDSSVEDSNAPVEYFNLQGVKVTNPSGGVFIRRQGSKSSKVLIAD